MWSSCRRFSTSGPKNPHETLRVLEFSSTSKVSPEELSERLNLNKVVLPAEFINKLRELNIVSATSIDELADHSRDWWPLSLQWAQKGMAPTFPGLVLYPTSVNEVAEILKTASEFKIPVTPAAGKSGVCGGVICVPGSVNSGFSFINEIKSSATVPYLEYR